MASPRWAADFISALVFRVWHLKQSLDAETVVWPEQHLRRYEGTVIAVTHDRYFLDNVAQWILELDPFQGIPWKGNDSSWLDQKQKRLAQEEKRRRLGANTTRPHRIRYRQPTRD